MADRDAVTPGRAACEAWWTTAGLAGHPEYMGHEAEYRNSRASWDASAQAVLDRAFPGLRREVDEARAELRSIAAELKSWPRCPDGCGCRLGTDDADRHDCSCDGPCTAECRENGYPDAPSYRDLAVRHVMDERDRLTESGQALERVAEHQARSLYAAQIEVAHGSTDAANTILTEALDGFGGPQWDGTESGLEWLERTHAGAVADRRIVSVPEVPDLTAEGNGPLLDPSCRRGEHVSCLGAPCECPVPAVHTARHDHERSKP